MPSQYGLFAATALATAGVTYATAVSVSLIVAAHTTDIIAQINENIKSLAKTMKEQQFYLVHMNHNMEAYAKSAAALRMIESSFNARMSDFEARAQREADAIIASMHGNNKESMKKVYDSFDRRISELREHMRTSVEDVKRELNEAAFTPQADRLDHFERVCNNVIDARIRELKRVVLDDMSARFDASNAEIKRAHAAEDARQLKAGVASENEDDQ